MSPRETVLLPDWHELLAAFCGHLDDDPDGHPVVRWARALAELHLRRHDEPSHAAEIDGGRAELVAAIDNWVGATLHPPRNRRRGPYPESLGGAVDRMAAAQVHATRLLHTVADISDERVHTAWHRLATLADDWSDLVDEVLHGQPRIRQRARSA
ncbi:hypothetical protein BJY24_001492 [Nocardia transvalensis]|uniref:DUF4254 domain-containing protein n=1 Tax=Nocardia transvalensis TaxID=37333 RepID=A0A7W9PAZ6_9NOCA|nr:hypothetical protein [Nocardia transvalensis]MBB5912625.1 hypothetical protein [Nocardia transvalensis]